MLFSRIQVIANAFWEHLKNERDAHVRETLKPNYPNVSDVAYSITVEASVNNAQRDAEEAINTFKSLNKGATPQRSILKRTRDEEEDAHNEKRGPVYTAVPPPTKRTRVEDATKKTDPYKRRRRHWEEKRRALQLIAEDKAALEERERRKKAMEKAEKALIERQRAEVRFRLPPGSIQPAYMRNPPQEDEELKSYVGIGRMLRGRKEVRRRLELQRCEEEKKQAEKEAAEQKWKEEEEAKRRQEEGDDDDEDEDDEEI
ncbi:hypothetical protein CYLTODRAFT_493994 [Cylindrobasidium torrendii FP15055 ss-10]|uniref:Uncharacterized protein n=1 Tax=Cylindrobasidium torrendii FP15055 ss-10 TaxID=1314674 RepID=A0A0D7AZI7_9AGAR|nr:hypothetical protein CYLTODRAFT_493994 [Cylindrobasidium torrendii FP15055 ss-10]